MKNIDLRPSKSNKKDKKLQLVLKEDKYEKLQKEIISSNETKYHLSEKIYYSPQIAMGFLEGIINTIHQILKNKGINDYSIKETGVLGKIMSIEDNELRDKLLNSREGVKLLSIEIETNNDKMLLYEVIKASGLVLGEFKKGILISRTGLLLTTIKIV